MTYLLYCTDTSDPPAASFVVSSFLSYGFISYRIDYCIVWYRIVSYSIVFYKNHHLVTSCYAFGMRRLSRTSCFTETQLCWRPAGQNMHTRPLRLSTNGDSPAMSGALPGGPSHACPVATGPCAGASHAHGQRQPAGVHREHLAILHTAHSSSRRWWWPEHNQSQSSHRQSAAHHRRQGA